MTPKPDAFDYKKLAEEIAFRFAYGDDACELRDNIAAAIAQGASAEKERAEKLMDAVRVQKNCDCDNRGFEIHMCDVCTALKDLDGK